MDCNPSSDRGLMGRQPLPLGQWGRIRVYAAVWDENGKPVSFRARTLYRDYDGHTRPVERSGRTKTRAERKLKESLARRQSGAGTRDLNGASRFSEAANLWIGDVRVKASSGSLSMSTAETYEGHLRRHVLPGLGEVRLGEITVPLLDRFFSLLSSSSGRGTSKSCRAVVSGVLGLTVRYGAIPSNPVRDVTAIGGKVRKPPTALTDDERQELLAQLSADEKAARQDVVDLVRFMLATGQRIGEVLALLWQDVNLDEGTVHVNATLRRLKGQGLVRTRPKSDAGDRILRLPSWAVEDLRRRNAKGVVPEEPVFHALGSKGLRDPRNAQRHLRKALDRAGSSGVTSHNFRKTIATLMDSAGLSARTIADQLGHARPSMTQDVYLARQMVDGRAVAVLESCLDFMPKSGD
jgi:integrase